MRGVDPRIPSGCAIAGMMSRAGEPLGGAEIARMIAPMRERSNGLGGGFAGYGLYPQYKDYYAFHLLFSGEEYRQPAEQYLHQHLNIIHDEPIPVRRGFLPDAPVLWRYFLEVPANLRTGMTEEDYLVRTVMEINTRLDGAFVVSCGKNMGVFKAVGYPEEVAEFYMLDQYRAHTWIAHGRFPTNTPGWWGGAHPFSLLDWSVVHNGEISSYGTNKRYVEMFGYRCSLQTDTEVVAYLLDLLLRRHNLPEEMVYSIMASPFWTDIDRMEPQQRELLTHLRMVYGSALLNGPFSFIIGSSQGMVGLTDRIMLRPMVAAEKGDLFFLASEEAAIREVCPEPDRVWNPPGGEPVIGRLYSVAGASKAATPAAARTSSPAQPKSSTDSLHGRGGDLW